MNHAQITKSSRYFGAGAQKIRGTSAAWVEPRFPEDVLFGNCLEKISSIGLTFHESKVQTVRFAAENSKDNPRRFHLWNICLHFDSSFIISYHKKSTKCRESYHTWILWITMYLRPLQTIIPMMTKGATTWWFCTGTQFFKGFFVMFFTRWTPTSYNWSCNPYKFTPLYHL